jgi:DNA modification methylase
MKPIETIVSEPLDAYTLDLFAPGVAKAGSQPTGVQTRDYGTFKDSLRAPVHRWFTYPAGFSYKAVEAAFEEYRVGSDAIVLDPFAGTGTTNVVAQQRGVGSIGVEAHPFVHFVAQTKLFWDFSIPDLIGRTDRLVAACDDVPRAHADVLQTTFPELVHKCYSPKKLADLHAARGVILQLPDDSFRRLARLALTALLRSAADVATGWPYIAPQKAKRIGRITPPVSVLLRDQLHLMIGDIQAMQRARVGHRQALMHRGDARDLNRVVAASIDLAFTSPPYLNNYDYADRTRLETYFWGEARSWSEITEKVRRKLIMSATTQINRLEYDEDRLLSDLLCRVAPEVAQDLWPKISMMSERRLEKGGKKSYDILTAGYFNDMTRVLQEVHRVLRPGAPFVLILGDSAPYGVYVPVEEYLGRIGLGVGFSRFKVESLRLRGGKWKANPQRHNIALKECVLTLFKA